MFLPMLNETVSTTITAPAAEINTTAPNSNLSETEELTSANVWKNRWVQKIDVNDTSVQFPTRIAFRMDENMERMLNTVPVNVLGTLCFQLARKGYHKLATVMGITPNELSKSDPLYLGLLEATLQAKAFSLSTSTNRLRKCQPSVEDDQLLYDAVNVICQLCKKPAVTLMTMSDALEKVDRTDLIPLLTDESETNDGLHPVRNSLQGGEGHGQV
ncbi:hypothetical protein AHF37_02952 [Paragonimus kellicotti]|nr:hypothetical protein AHF37_02952 [Paragonimus kellicotti]